MNLQLTPAQESFRDEVRRWLADHVPSSIGSAGTPDGFAAHVEWEHRLAAAGYAAIHWPEAYGGRGAGAVEQAIFEEEYVLAGGPERVTVVGQNLMGPTLMAHGTEEQRARWLPGILDATTIWSQGYSEPGAGSDLASVQTRGVVHDDHLEVTGQKIWTSYGAHADWIFALVRTDPSAAKHAGISFVAIDMSSDGVEARPITQLDGHQGFAEVFFDGVRVPRDQVVGGLGQGWQVAMTALEFERDAPAAAPARYQRDLEEVARIAAEMGLADDDAVVDGLGRLAVRVEAYRLRAERTLARLADGEDIGYDSSATKLVWSHLERDLFEFARDLLGPHGELTGTHAPLADEADWRSRYWYARAATIYAGTSQIQRGIVARRILGLPKVAYVAMFTDEQTSLADVCRDLFAEVSDPSRLRSVWEGDGHRGTDVWRRIAALGLPAIGITAEHGGMGGGMADLVRVCEEAGAAGVPEPLVESIVVAGPLLSEAGTDEQQRRWLPGLASGELVATVGLPGEPHVLDADVADVLLLWDGERMLVCDPTQVATERRPSEDRARRLFAVTRADGPPMDEAAEATAVERAVDRARIGTAASCNGVSRRLLAMAVEHATMREQFGSPIGAFQAVQHLLADLHVAVDTARGTAWGAAIAYDRNERDAARLARVAKAAAAETAARVNTDVLQVLAGIGFTWEHDLHLWLKRGKALEASYGSARTHHRALGNQLLRDVA